MLHCEKKYNKEIKANKECRGIMDFPKYDDGNRKSYGQLSMKNLLLIDETKNLAAELKACQGITPSDVKHIASRSTEMIALVI